MASCFTKKNRIRGEREREREREREKKKKKKKKRNLLSDSTGNPWTVPEGTRRDGG